MSIVRAAVDTADLILAEVNPNMPKNIGQRAHALIGIAHPDFRAELLAAARRRCFIVPG